jgi:hypothetical protein
LSTDTLYLTPSGIPNHTKYFDGDALSCFDYTPPGPMGNFPYSEVNGVALEAPPSTPPTNTTQWQCNFSAAACEFYTSLSFMFAYATVSCFHSNHVSTPNILRASVTFRCGNDNLAIFWGDVSIGDPGVVCSPFEITGDFQWHRSWASSLALDFADTFGSFGTFSVTK